MDWIYLIHRIHMHLRDQSLRDRPDHREFYLRVFALLSRLGLWILLRDVHGLAVSVSMRSSMAWRSPGALSLAA